MCRIIEGNTRLYQFDSEALQSISKEIFTPDNMVSLVEDVDTEVWETQVLKNFMEGEFLKEIPASRKKRLVIPKWLIRQFEVGVSYPERMVNEILKRYHPDCATLRRELIGYQLMQRENGIY